jgi:hypothetical protein
MDSHQFDRLTRSVDQFSRRQLALTAGRLALAAAMAGIGLAPKTTEAQSCRNDGAKCKRVSDCCSGTCQKRGKKGKGKNRKRRCGATPPEAFGCTVQQNSCDLEEPIACPERASGNCFVTVNNQPFCGNDLECFACQTDQDCVDEIGKPGFRCIQCNGECGDTSTACMRLTEV